MLSVVIPCHDEEQSLPPLCARLRPVLDALDTPYELIMVDDGSRDATLTVLVGLQGRWPQLRVRALTSNVGHQQAITAGLDIADGDFVITMDADLQDPPELIPQLLECAQQQGVDVVYAAHHERDTDTWFKRRSAGLYYWMMRRSAGVDLEPHVGDFRLMSARVVRALRALPERHRVYRLLVPWLGFPSATVDFARAERVAGRTKYTLRRMLTLTIDSTTSFTTTPLRFATALGVTTAGLSLLAAVGTVAAWTAGRTVPGWASLTVVVLFLGSVQLLCVGVLGEYLGRVYQEVQRRPLYTLARDLPPVDPDRPLGGARSTREP